MTGQQSVVQVRVKGTSPVEVDFKPLRSVSTPSHVNCSIEVRYDQGGGRIDRHQCKQSASCMIDGIAMCGHHAGAYLFRKFMNKPT